MCSLTNEYICRHAQSRLIFLVAVFAGATAFECDAAGTSFAGETPEGPGWYLDELGNWAGNAAVPGGVPGLAGLLRFVDANGNTAFEGAADTLDLWQRHEANQVNEVETLVSGDAVGTNGVRAFAYDAAGNLVYDGHRFYRYDAWNRLVEVDAAGTLTVGTNGLPGGLEALEGEPGDLLARYEYDALGRRVATVDCRAGDCGTGVSPASGGAGVPPASGGAGVPPASGGAGVSPAYSPGKADAGGRDSRRADAGGRDSRRADAGGRDSCRRTTRYVYGSGPEVLAEYDVDSNGVETLARWFVHGESFPNPLVMVDVTDAGDLPAVGRPGGEEEYLYYLKDALGSVMALADAGGQIVERSFYDPYGQTVILDPERLFADTDGDGDADLRDFAAFQQCFGGSDSAGASPSQDCEAFDADGDDHIGLFDFGVFAAVLAGADEPARLSHSAFGNPFLWTGQRYDPATGHYAFLARTYSPSLGRFLERDPLGVLSPAGEVSWGEAGEAPFLSGSATGPGYEYPDGLNLYQYVRANPVRFTDPFGRDSWDDWVDEEIAGITGHKLYALGTINEGAKWAAIGLNVALDIAGSLLGLDIFESVEVLRDGRGGFWEAMNIVAAVNPLGRVGKVGAVLAKAGKWRRAGRVLGKVAESMDDLIKLAPKWKRGYDPGKLAEAAQRFPHFAGRTETHHIIPQFLDGPVSGPTVKVDKAYHQLITNAFRKEWPYGQDPPNPAKLEEILEKVYTELPLPR